VIKSLKNLAGYIQERLRPLFILNQISPFALSEPDA